MIDGVRITPRRQIVDERGKIMRMLRVDDPEFERFGEVYFSVVYPNVVKAWHLHREMTLNYAVVFGKIKLALYDGRPESPTYRELWNGFKGIGLTQAIVANCATHPHDPGEIVRMSPFDPSIGYDWDVKHG